MITLIEQIAPALTFSIKFVCIILCTVAVIIIFNKIDSKINNHNRKALDDAVTTCLEMFRQNIADKLVNAKYSGDHSNITDSLQKSIDMVYTKVDKYIKNAYNENLTDFVYKQLGCRKCVTKKFFFKYYSYKFYDIGEISDKLSSIGYSFCYPEDMNIEYNITVRVLVNNIVDVPVEARNIYEAINKINYMIENKQPLGQYKKYENAYIVD